MTVMLGPTQVNVTVNSEPARLFVNGKVTSDRMTADEHHRNAICLTTSRGRPLFPPSCVRGAAATAIHDDITPGSGKGVVVMIQTGRSAGARQSGRFTEGLATEKRTALERKRPTPPS
jgi:hypothetical protein